ncbi:RTA1 like protein-domain-containing protein [Podospora fimiseda]|uniref:RTA1 like protein-domain-containing protein n=1 Tax=Podospora fimiseda TaxID=252190 RepID=A0AAN7BS43_9PEZI|nr:RTA1 like protein-domain-containing protein [Podospora fimiseda]
MSENGESKGGLPKVAKYYDYEPNMAANIVFVVLFATVTLGHSFFMFKMRTWYFIPFVIGVLFEALGYIFRVIAAGETYPNYTFIPYLLQTLLILLGPALLAASIYMVLGRLIRLLDAHQYALIRVTWTTKVFVLGDVLSFITQGAGGGILANADTKSANDLGRNIILVGLAIQVIFFGFFILTTIIFHYRIHKNPTPRSYSVTGSWRYLILVLYAASVLVMVRSIFRMIEFSAGRESELMTKEVYLLVLDALLMFLVGGLFLWKFPGKVLVGYKEISKMAGKSGGGVTTDEENNSGMEGIQMMGQQQQRTPQPYEPYMER